MNHFSPEEVINIEIKLLQSPGKTLTTLHKYHLMQKTEKQNIIFKKFDKNTISSKLKKMVITNVYALIDDPNANLRAFSIIILKLIFARQEKEQILWCLKSHLHQLDIDIKKFEQIPKSNYYQQLVLLSKEENKKIIVQFLHLLKQSSEDCMIQNQCKKYPLALQLLIFFWRTILAKFQGSETYNFSKKIPAQTCFPNLFDILDIFYRKSEELYFFQQDNLFIQVGYQSQGHQYIDEIIIGEYYENEQQYLKRNMKNQQSPLCLNRNNLKFSAQTFNPNYSKFHDLDKVNPFQLIISNGSSIIIGKKDMKTSNCSLKSSNAFEKKHFNLPSNRSDYTANLQDSQCDNPTPSFNHVTEDQAHDLFQPQNQSLKTIKNQYPTRGTHAPFNMKQSATIINFKNTFLKSSLLKENNRKLKGSLQIYPQKSFQFENEKKKNHTRIKTDKNQLIQSLKIHPIPQKVQTGQKNQQFHDQKRKMKRSQSQKNSLIRQGQFTHADETNRVSLFDINCKKLKTSMQIDEFDFLSEKKTILKTTENINHKYFNQICENSAYTCSCSSYKLQKNQLNSNIFAFTYEPQNLLNRNFKKKNQEEKNSNEIFKKKSKLNDDFFKKLKAKRQELRTSNQKNKSDPKHKSKQQQRNVKKQYFTKYSQFIKINERNRQASKTPDKEMKSKNKTKTTFPSTFQNFHSFFDKFQTKNRNKKQQIKGFCFFHNKQKGQFLNKKNSLNENQKSRFKHQQSINSLQRFFYKMYSSPVTPNQNLLVNQQQQILLHSNTSTSLQEMVSLEKTSNNKIRKQSLKENKKNHEFSQNDHLFIDPPL